MFGVLQAPDTCKGDDAVSLKRPIVLGNWKMNGLLADGEARVAALRGRAGGSLAGTLGVFPPATLLGSAAGWTRGTPILLGAQDCHARDSGAFTGDLAPSMLKEAGATAVIVGHSERRQYHGETDAQVQAKADAALGQGLLAVVCIGETEAEYLAGDTLERLQTQLAGSLPDAATSTTVVVAYEPVWAIGTRRTPTTREIARAHGFIREKLAARFADGAEIGILYGGSVKPENATEILAVENVDGALVGGASLDADGFWSIYAAGLGNPT